VAPAAQAEFVVNQMTAYTQDYPAVAVAADGTFVVTWNDGNVHVSARRFDSAGLPLGGEFDVDSTSDPLLFGNPPEIGFAADGSFVIVFESTAGAQVRRYDASAGPLGAEFLVPSAPTNTDNEDVAVAPDGRFVVVWGDQVTDTISARRFDGGGTPLGPEFLVASLAQSSGIAGARLGIAADGRFVVAWTDGEVYAQRYDAAGSADGAILQLNAGVFGNETSVDIDMAADGSFVAVWESPAFGLDEVRGRRFDATGAPLGGDFVVASADDPTRPSVDIAPDGSFVVGFSHATGDGDAYGVFIRHYDASGTALGPVNQANAFETGDQKNIVVAAGSGGRAVAVWNSDILDGSANAVVAQRYLDGFVDQPVAAGKVVLKQSTAKETAVFLSKDPLVPIPPIDSADDPATGTPGGVLVEFFSPAEGLASFSVPAGIGLPGWTVRPRPLTDLYKFVNKDAPAGPSVAKVVVWKARKVFKVKAHAIGLPMAGPQTGLGVRVTAGTRRFCAFFDGATIKRDQAGKFIAKDAPAAALADCSDATMNGLL
jgi:hypothetical protein